MVLETWSNYITEHLLFSSEFHLALLGDNNWLKTYQCLYKVSTQ